MKKRILSIDTMSNANDDMQKKLIYRMYREERIFRRFPAFNVVTQ